MSNGALVLADIIQEFQDFNFQRVLYAINFEQIVVAIVAAVFCVLFGVFAGACIIYPTAFRRGAKAEKMLNEERKRAAAEEAKEAARRLQEEQRAKNVEDTFDEDDDYDFSFDEDEEEEAIPEQEAQPAVQPVTQQQEEQEPAPVAAAHPQQEEQEPTAAPVQAQPQQAAPAPAAIPMLIDVTPTAEGEELSESNANTMAVLQDENFLRLVAEKQRQAGILNRQVVLAYAHRMRPLASSLPIRIVPAGDKVNYDRIQSGDYTFAVVTERRKVLKLYIRLHANTVQALQNRAGEFVTRAPDLGDDWYSWIVTDLSDCERLVAKVLDMSYKYVSHAAFARDASGELHAVAPLYEETLAAALGAIDVENDAAFVAASDSLNEKYRLDYFSRKDACRFVSSIQGDLTTTTQDEVASSGAILKADAHIFAIVFENRSVVKVIFRAPIDYVNELAAVHPYVGKSDFPHNALRWYYAILDESFSRQDCEELLRHAYDYMITRYVTNA